jgi:hypothetical protein
MAIAVSRQLSALTRLENRVYETFNDDKILFTESQEKLGSHPLTADS